MRKSIILAVCLSILTALFTHLSPISYAEDSTAILYDGNAQSFLLLNENETEVLSLSKVTDEGSIYQWEILIDEENGAWVELENQNDDQYEAVYETLKELAGEDDTVQLRCKVTANEEVSYSNVLSVELFSHDSEASLFNLDSEEEKTDSESTESEGLDEYETELIEDEVEENLNWVSYNDYLKNQNTEIVWNHPEFYVGLTAVFNSSWGDFRLTDGPEYETYATGSFYDDNALSTVEESDKIVVNSGKVLLEQVRDLKVVVTDYYFRGDVNPQMLWFKVEAADGYTLPDELQLCPWILQAIFSKDTPSLLFVPTQGILVNETVQVQKDTYGASRYFDVPVSSLPEFIDVEYLYETTYNSSWYNIGDLTGYVTIDGLTSEYVYVKESEVVLIPAEVSAAYDRLLNSDSLQEYYDIFESIPEEIRNQFTDKHEANVESHFNHIYAIENVEVATTTTINGVDVPVKVKGKIPETAILSVTPVTNETVQSEGFKVAVEDIVLALDIKIYNEGVEWQPEEGFPVDLMLDMTSLGHEDNTVFELHHKHGEKISKNDVFVVMDGMLTIRTSGFSIYVVANTNATQNITGEPIIDNNENYTMIIGQSKVFYIRYFGDYTSADSNGTWRVNDPEGAIHYTVHANVTSSEDVGHNQVRARWLKVIALKETENPITISYTNGNSTETFKLNVEVPKADKNQKKLYIKDNVNQYGKITATLVDENGKELDLAGAAFAWKRSDGLFIVPPAYEDAYRSVNIARDHGGLVEARKKADGTGYEPVTYTVEVTLPDDSRLTASYTVYYQSEIINAGFEFPNAKANDYSFFPNGWPELYWKTTAPGTGTGNITKDIEYGDVTSHTEGGTSYTVLYAADHKDGGVQFAELNAEEIGALYQDIISAPGEEIKWRFSHARRDNQSWAPNVQNRMYIVIGATEDAQKLSNDQLNALVRQARNEANNNAQFLAGTKYEEVVYSGKTYFVWYHSAQEQTNYTQAANYGWVEISGEYLVPSGQYRTRLFFVSDPDTNSGNKNAGNLIDISKAGQYKSYLIEYYEETFHEGVKELRHVEGKDEYGNSLVYSSAVMENFNYFINEEHDYLHRVVINGSVYPYDIRYAGYASLYIEKYDGKATKPDGCSNPSTNNYDDYDIVMQVYFRDTVISVQKVLKLPDLVVQDGVVVSGMTEEQKLTLMNNMNSKGGYKSYFDVYNVDEGEYVYFDENYTTITSRDPKGNFTGYVAVGENPELNHKYVVEEMRTNDTDPNYDLENQLLGLELSSVKIEVVRYSQGAEVNEDLAIFDYKIVEIDDDTPIKSTEFELTNNEKEPAKSIKIADVTVTNYYKEKMTTVYYKAIGKGKVKLEGTDWEDMPSETLAFYSGKAKGGVVEAGKGATFVGWFKDPSCSEESRVTAADGVYDPVTHSFKPNANIINTEEITFYALFETGTIVIEKPDVTDLDQVFVYHVTNNLEGKNKLDIYVTLTPDENGNYRREIHEIADATITVTEVNDWNWRYPSETKSEEYSLEEDGKYTFEFKEPSNKDKWLNVFDLLKNAYGKMTGGGS